MDEQRLVDAMVTMLEASSQGHEADNSGGFDVALSQNESLRHKIESLPQPQRQRLLTIVEQVRVLLQRGKDDVDGASK